MAIQNWIKVDPQTVPAGERDETRFFNEAIGETTAAASGATAADREDIAMMAIESQRKGDGRLDAARCRGTARNHAKQCHRCKQGKLHKFAGFTPQTALALLGDDALLPLAERKSPWSGRAPSHRPDYYLCRREANAAFGKRLDALPDGLREVAYLIDASHDILPPPTNRERAALLTKLTGELWTPRRYRRTLGRLKRRLLKQHAEKLRRILCGRGQVRPCDSM